MKLECAVRILVAGAALSAGCTKATTSTQQPGAPEAWRTHNDPKGGFSFEHPASWTIEDSKTLGGLLATCPTIKAGWQANLFFEVVTETEEPLVATDRNLPFYKDAMTDFKAVGRGAGTNPAGLATSTLEYSHTSDGVRLMDSKTIIAVGKEKRIYVLASAAEVTIDEYRPIFARALDSIAAVPIDPQPAAANRDTEKN